jgi:hypothetical protein
MSARGLASLCMQRTPDGTGQEAAIHTRSSGGSTGARMSATVLRTTHVHVRVVHFLRVAPQRSTAR